jgi:hypothetical protein
VNGKGRGQEEKTERKRKREALAKDPGKEDEISNEAKSALEE